MWQCAVESDKEPQVLRKRLQHNRSPCEDGYRRVFLMVSIPHHIPLAKQKRDVCNEKWVILRHRVRGSVRAVRAVRNTRVSLIETWVVSDTVTTLIGSSVTIVYTVILLFCHWLMSLITLDWVQLYSLIYVHPQWTVGQFLYRIFTLKELQCKQKMLYQQMFIVVLSSHEEEYGSELQTAQVMYRVVTWPFGMTW